MTFFAEGSQGTLNWNTGASRVFACNHLFRVGRKYSFLFFFNLSSFARTCLLLFFFPGRDFLYFSSVNRVLELFSFLFFFLVLFGSVFTGVNSYHRTRSRAPKVSGAFFFFFFLSTSPVSSFFQPDPHSYTRNQTKRGNNL